MERFGLVEAIQSYCATNSIVFAYGDAFHKNYELTIRDIAINQLILCFDPPLYTLSSNRNQILSYECNFLLGRKRENSTATWQKKTTYSRFDLISPTTANGFIYRCRVGGESDDTDEPIWPLTLGTSITDGKVVWECVEPTEASLNETWLQKYYNRLAQLKRLANEFINDIACANELSYGSVLFVDEIDKFDEDIDFVGFKLTFEQ